MIRPATRRTTRCRSQPSSSAGFRRHWENARGRRRPFADVSENDLYTTRDGSPLDDRPWSYKKQILAAISVQSRVLVDFGSPQPGPVDTIDGFSHRVRYSTRVFRRGLLRLCIFQPVRSSSGAVSTSPSKHKMVSAQRVVGFTERHAEVFNRVHGNVLKRRQIRFVFESVNVHFEIQCCEMGVCFSKIYD